nr:hypothetical protein [Mycoplasmopsis bovis]
MVKPKEEEEKPEGDQKPGGDKNPGENKTPGENTDEAKIQKAKIKTLAKIKHPRRKYREQT